MPDKDEPQDLEQLLRRIGEADADEDDEVTVGALLDAIGHRSFGALLLAAGLFTLAPGPADIPGVPIIVAVIVFLVAVQLLVRQDHIWLPDWILRRDIRQDRLEKAVGWLRRPAALIDRWIRPRLKPLVTGPGAYAIAIGCLLIALALPPMEIVPFSANLGGGALTAYAIALLTRDGVVGILAHLVTLGALGVVLYNLL